MKSWHYFALGMMASVPVAYGIIYVFRKPLHDRAVAEGTTALRNELETSTSGLVTASSLPGLDALTSKLVSIGVNAGFGTIGIPRVSQ